MNNIEKKETPEWQLAELRQIMNHVFFSIVQVDLFKNTAYIMQSVDHPEWVAKELDWGKYLAGYEELIAAEAFEDLTSSHLLKVYRSGKTFFSKDICYRLNKSQEWMSVEVFMKSEDGRPYATVITKESTKRHLQQSIIEQFVYKRCDHFAILNARTSSFETFGGNADGRQIPERKYDNYSTEVIKYVKHYVVPEERVNVIRQMNLSYIQEQLEQKETYVFSFGVNDPVRGYVRKQLEYQYYDRAARMILLSRTDITDIFMREREKQTELLAALKRACTDSLTGLLNHQGTVDQVSFYLKEEDDRQSALMFIDMDNFKDVNDSLGHIAGDDLLRQVAEILRSGVRANDLVGRVGGDEFLVFLRNIKNIEEAKQCAKRLCRGIHRLSTKFAFPVSCSIGIAVSPEDGTDYTTLTESADKRVYHAKSRGKNQISIK